MFPSTKSYKISQEANLNIKKIGEKATQIIDQLRFFHTEEDIESFQQKAQELINCLNSDFSLPPLTVKLKDSPRQRWRMKRGGTAEKFGYYSGKSVTIFIRTPRKQKLTAFITLISTILHEWLHHYDRYHLKIQSFHTTGFYRRLNQLEDALAIRKTPEKS